jgi:hypothetical protein
MLPVRFASVLYALMLRIEAPPKRPIITQSHIVDSPISVPNAHHAEIVPTAIVHPTRNVKFQATLPHGIGALPGQSATQ